MHHTLSSLVDCWIAYVAVILMPDLFTGLVRAYDNIPVVFLPNGIVHSLVGDLLQKSETANRQANNRGPPPWKGTHPFWRARMMQMYGTSLMNAIKKQELCDDV